jgi:hypothetical protein
MNATTASFLGLRRQRAQEDTQEDTQEGTQEGTQRAQTKNAQLE